MATVVAVSNQKGGVANTTTAQAVAAVLGCSPFAVQYARRDNKHLAPRIKDLYAYALDLEYQIKSGRVGVNNAIVLLTMNI